MPVKRISLQLRTRSAESQPAISDTPPTTPSSSQEYSHSAKAESVGKGPRPSRLKPTVPLHMTTRRHKSGLQSSVLTQSKQATKIASPSTEAEEHTIVQKMPPKRISSVVSGAQETDEHLKKRLRGPQAPKTNGISHSNAGPKEANDTPRVDALKLASSVHKRPRGRPPLRPKASLPTIEKVNTATNTPTTSRKESSYVQEVPESISNTTSRAASDIVRPKVPKKTLFDQYHSKHQLALKHATTEQLRRRQSRIQQQYNLLAQLAKKNNALLIEKSIEILNNISDVDLARTEWVASILAGLEKAEEARMKQIHFDKKVSLINAFHTYDAERQRIEAEYQNHFLEIQEAYIQKSKEKIQCLRQRYEPLEHSPAMVEGAPSKKLQIGDPPEKLDALALLAQVCEQQHRVQREKTGVFTESEASPAHLLQSGLV